MKEKNIHAQELGRLGGRAGKGKTKARHVTSDMARKAVNVRWRSLGRKLRIFNNKDREFRPFEVQDFDCGKWLSIPGACFDTKAEALDCVNNLKKPGVKMADEMASLTTKTTEKEQTL